MNDETRNDGLEKATLAAKIISSTVKEIIAAKEKDKMSTASGCSEGLNIDSEEVKNS